MLRRIDYEKMMKAEEQDPEAVQEVRDKLIEISSFLSTDFVHINADIPGDSFKMYVPFCRYFCLQISSHKLGIICFFVFQ